MSYQSGYSSFHAASAKKTKRAFIAFAIEDKDLRTLLAGQAKNEKSTFEFTDMSAKKPWDSEWRKNARTRIKGCDGVIGIITDNTKTATGQLFELQCAYEENVPVLLIYGNDDRPTGLPEPVKGRRIHLWTWDNIKNFLDKL